MDFFIDEFETPKYLIVWRGWRQLFCPAAHHQNVQVFTAQ
jgi:hypothetical protein